MNRFSILQNKKECFICKKVYGLEFHHCIFGKNRKKADEDLLTVYLCNEHHRGTNGVHGKNGHELDLKLKQLAEKTWCEYYNKNIEDFIIRYGKNYI